MSTRIPTSTYRLQFHGKFTLKDATELLPYLDSFGISHVYASPFFQASPGSLHGYDVCSHENLNPELGSREDYERLAAGLEHRGIGLIMDFVPNHMGISETSNKWWTDVLENGPSSLYSSYFDIDWHPIKPELGNKVLLPILGEQYGQVIERGDLRLRFIEGGFCLDYLGRALPVAPCSWPLILERARETLAFKGIAVDAEFDSILLGLHHLPPIAEADASRKIERAREKEILKSRLAGLCLKESVIRDAIETTLRELQDPAVEGSLDAFDGLLQAQAYRLASWRVAGEEINYRRFFDVNTLAAIRMELPEVFDATHRLLMELLSSGAAQGLRIDHVDGLYNPGEYLARLQQRYAEARGISGDADRPLFLLVEKILGPHEHLRNDWPVHGTTGYEVTNLLCGLQIEPKAEAAFNAIYSKFTSNHTSCQDTVYESKMLVMRLSMASEVNVLAHMLNQLSESNRWYRDFTLNLLTDAIREVIASFPVYRTYITPDGQVSEEDARVIGRAIAGARRRNPSLERSAFDFLHDVLIPPENNPHPVDEDARIRFVMKFQQCTSPITAKGVEDTAFYRYNRLVALNEVGGEPSVFGIPVDIFHQKNMERLKNSPHTLATTSTHDTKRSEDTRARIAALSEMPVEWERAIRRWQTANRKHVQTVDDRTAPEANEEYLLYQNLLGSWPLHPLKGAEREAYVRRIQDYMVKAIHEAKVNSWWSKPNAAWEEAVSAFVRSILTPGTGNRFLKDFQKIAQRVAELGMVNSLAQTVLKLTLPGIPDIYQGQELWDFSLVDPDNRRPVDFALCQQRLEQVSAADLHWEELLREWRDGRIKMALTRRLLMMRRAHGVLFQRGSYAPVRVEGQHAECCVAFRRQHGKHHLLVIAPRLTARVGTPPVGACWQDTRLADAGGGTWVSSLTGEEVQTSSGLLLSEALRTLPVGVYERDDE